MSVFLCVEEMCFPCIDLLILTVNHEADRCSEVQRDLSICSHSHSCTRAQLSLNPAVWLQSMGPLSPCCICLPCVTLEVLFATNGSWFSSVPPAWIVPMRPSFPQDFHSFSSASFGRLGLPEPCPGQLTCPVADCMERGRRCHHPQLAAPATAQLTEGGGEAITRKRQAKLPRNHRAFFFFLDSDVTVWWQESYPVSFPSSHNNPVPENLPLRAQNISLRHVKMRAKPLGVRPNTACEHESSQRPPALPSSICKTPRFQSCREKNRGNRAAPAPFQSGRRLKKSKHLTILSIMLQLGTNMASLVSYTLTPQGCS